jgi:hypothetical protein
LEAVSGSVALRLLLLLPPSVIHPPLHPISKASVVKCSPTHGERALFWTGVAQFPVVLMQFLAVMALFPAEMGEVRALFALLIPLMLRLMIWRERLYSAASSRCLLWDDPSLFSWLSPVFDPSLGERRSVWPFLRPVSFLLMVVHAVRLSQ